MATVNFAVNALAYYMNSEYFETQYGNKRDWAWL